MSEFDVENAIRYTAFSVTSPYFEERHVAQMIREACEEILKLRAVIGAPPDGSHPDERAPRAETWHQERANWKLEVESLRAENDALRAAHDPDALAHEAAQLDTIESLRTRLAEAEKDFVAMTRFRDQAEDLRIANARLAASHAARAEKLRAALDKITTVDEYADAFLFAEEALAADSATKMTDPKNSLAVMKQIAKFNADSASPSEAAGDKGET